MQIVVDASAVANYERFASSIRGFVVYGSTVYPTQSWGFLGYFKASDSSELQVFPVDVATWTKWVSERSAR